MTFSIESGWRTILDNPLMQPAPLIFIGMTVAFGIVLLVCSIGDALRR